MTVLAWLKAYAAHDDPATHAANIVAMVVGWNGPFYPIYMVFLLGWQIAGASLLTTLAAPLFLAIPLLSRRSSVAARLLLPLIGAANTVWCLKLLGADSGIDLFFLPCVILAVLLYRRREKPPFLVSVFIPSLLNFLPTTFLGATLIPLNGGQASSMRTLNESSVICLTVFIAFQFSNLLRNGADDCNC